MSWWIGVEAVVDTGHSVEQSLELYDRNVTYNLSPMFYKAFDLEDGIRGLDKMLCSEAAPHIEEAIRRMTTDKDEYVKLNPENGWGTYDGAMEFLNEWFDAVREHPKARVYVH
jgi:hypothetical protein